MSPAPDDYPARYRAGESIETLSLDAGCGAKTMRKRLADAGVEIRPRKGPQPGAKYNTTSTTEGAAGRDPAARIVRPSVSRLMR